MSTSDNSVYYHEPKVALQRQETVDSKRVPDCHPCQFQEGAGTREHMVICLHLFWQLRT